MKRALAFALLIVAASASLFATLRVDGRLSATPQPVHPGSHLDSPALHLPRAQATRPGVPTRTKSKPVATPASTPYVVLFVLDGARPDYFSVPGIPHVRKLIANGSLYADAWAGILESETPSGHATIGTGSEPRADGILSFNWANGDNIPVNIFDPGVIQRGTLENIMKAAHAPTIAALVHQRDRSAKVVALGGHKYYAVDAIGGPDADVITYYTGTPDGKYAPTFVPGHGPPAGVLTAPGLVAGSTHLSVGVEDHLTMKLYQAIFARMHQRVTLVNLPEFDWPLGHVDGGDRKPAEVRALMQGFDRDLGRLEELYRKAGILNRTIWVITSDHGMAPIYHTVSKTDLTNAVRKAGTSIISDTYHTAAYLWIKDERRASAAAANIARLQNPYIQSVYFRETVSGRFRYVRATGVDLFQSPGTEAANQYLLATFDGPNSPDLAVFFREDAASLPDGEAQWKGDHGGAGWESQHLPLLLSGPGVRAGYISRFPARLQDIAPTVLSLMGVPSTGMEGTALADAIKTPSDKAVAAQRQVGASLAPVVSALQAESRADVRSGR